MSSDFLPVRRALLSVSDKTGLIDLARALAARNVVLLSTGGTAKAIREAGLAVKDVAELTGFPEMMDGRVKTLHPLVHGGLLGRAGSDDAVMAQHGIAAIDLLVLNLYPFEAVTSKADCTLAEAVENIDIGGPAMLRSAAKNFARVAVATDPAQYADLLADLEAHDGQLSAAKRFALSVAAFNRVAQYDAAISNYLSTVTDPASEMPVRAAFPAQANGTFVKVMDLRYGENPHQHAAFYRDLCPAPGSLATFQQLQGKELSYNNIADSDAAWECVRQFDAPACVIVKHANPCGVAVGAACGDAYELAYATDPTSAFGGILAFNRPLDAATAKVILDRQFVEVLIAPDYDEAALEYAKKKANVRVLRIALAPASSGFIDTKRIGSGLLMQTADDRVVSRDELKVVTRLAPTEAQFADLLFAWKVAKYVKSNAIVYAKDKRTIGVGAGQMSRVYSARIAGIKAADAELVVQGSVMASDAFFPFRDGIDAAAAAGIKAVIQPGGSMRDGEVIGAADEHGIAMVFTGVRHFRH
ncbi:bifunctional phosphoribosylaminoimidazolecarboxamide formyltransferase/IMP cyclohydrolase [Xanthomonas graminis]|jgi:phosphoribosylaminoimidazolecarboxamide formyltransferase/IMP cyclohydrolase|uniref:Bifunctional purine biosynthesis protein PurH n=1 Tax=Xanthomonas graminis pv. graminis TaxID=134874 RepID=A0A1M4J3K9_9XANT|nr:bifunctional phosphoribosylaminoimidazolecarboxamide formyltransferase/IMP cyclohydrolase [Xanthomonas translucens]EKU26713.1 bifunctional purine biosynthesis protein [Xanthomonas translucens pv. graminis ART-Xtg29]OAX58899.1 bifunctional phosphoribosylaminoimidazolecarboxamide formyltransferase/inosine monophosphate cyclohydrolase [Xanthomonas translucens pv. graminis]UKE54548.1 bifunctional phosphoribosylaminoimidazolecarboxamide formyltransferase/IMP cyclohydrolase [Xanthomonas translucens